MAIFLRSHISRQEKPEYRLMKFLDSVGDEPLIPWRDVRDILTKKYNRVNSQTRRATTSSGAEPNLERQQSSDQAKDEFETVLDLCHPVF
jgi:hypothetical protein